LRQSDKPLLQVLAGERRAVPPCWLMRQAGRYLPEYRAVRGEAGSFLDLCFSPDKAVEVTLQPIRRYGFDAAILFSDILVVPYALGQMVRFEEGEGPKLTPIGSQEAVERLNRTGFLDRLAPVFDAVRGISRQLPETTTLIGFAGAPWTVATYMVEGAGSRDFVKAKSMAYGNPTLFRRLIELLVEATGDYLIGQIDHGAEVIKLFDSWAGVLAEEAFNDWVIEPTRRLVDRIHQERPGIPVIGFPRGAGILYQRFAEMTKVDGLALDSAVPLAWAVETLAPMATLQGNLDPALVVIGGAAMERAVDTIRHLTRTVPFVFNLGHGILPQTPPDHVAVLVERVRRTAE